MAALMGARWSLSVAGGKSLESSWVVLALSAATPLWLRQDSSSRAALPGQFLLTRCSSLAMGSRSGESESAMAEDEAEEDEDDDDEAAVR